MRTKIRIISWICIFMVLLLPACESEDLVSPGASSQGGQGSSGTQGNQEYTGTFELRWDLDQTVSNGALSYTLKALVPVKFAWSAENKRYKITGTDKNAQGVVTLNGGQVVTCTGNMTGTVEISGWVYPVRLNPCEFKLFIFQNWSGSNMTCLYTFPTTYTQEVPNMSAPFSASDEFSFVATTGEKSQRVSYTSGALTGFLRFKIKSFSGSTIQGCGVTY